MGTEVLTLLLHDPQSRNELTERPRIVFVTQVIDPDDSVLGFVLDWITALASYSDRVVVVANEVRRIPRDFNIEVISLGKEHRARKLSRFAQYQQTLRHLARVVKPDAILAHMCPIYLNAAAPIAVRYGIKKVMWFAHPAVHPQLLLAEQLADVILTSFAGAYPRKASHVRAIGQAIDVDVFQPGPFRRRGTQRHALVLGRTSPSKGIPSIIEGADKARAAGVDLRLLIVGSASTPEEMRHRRQLEMMADKRSEFVRLIEGVPREQLPGLLQDSDVLINGMLTGSGDKVVLEAMAAGRPVVLSNRVFFSLLADFAEDLFYDERDSDDLAQKLVRLLSLDPDALQSIGSELRNRVVRDHSLEHWAREAARSCVGR